MTFFLHSTTCRDMFTVFTASFRVFRCWIRNSDALFFFVKTRIVMRSLSPPVAPPPKTAGVFLSLYIFWGAFNWLMIFPIHFWKGKNVGDVLLAWPGNVSSIVLPVFNDLLLDATVLCVCQFCLGGQIWKRQEDILHLLHHFLFFPKFPSSPLFFVLPVHLGLNVLLKLCVYVCVKRSGFNGKWTKTKHFIYGCWWNGKQLL